MKISTRGTYALRMLIDLAQNQGDGYVCLGELCERQNISRKYLDQITPLLQKDGILTSCRGNCGGFRLALAPENVTAARVLRLTEGSLGPVDCVKSDNDCEKCDICPVYPLWQGLEKAITDYLESVTLHDLIRQNENGDAHQC